MSQTDPQKMIDKIKDDYNLIATEWDMSRSGTSQYYGTDSKTEDRGHPQTKKHWKWIYISSY